ncbi:MAG: glycosyltransferase family 4 protein [Vicinamibacterales bacterium]
MASIGYRVLMLLENNPYPQDPRVRNEAETLAAAGYEVSVIAPASPRQPWRERVGNVEVRRYPPPRPVPGALGYVWEYGYSLLAVWVLSLGVWLSRGVDVVHAHNPPDVFFVIGGMFRLFGKKFVFDHHDLAPEMYTAKFGARARPLLVRLLVLCERMSCRLAHSVIATNESYRAMEMQRSALPADRITVVRNGPDLKRLVPVEPDQALRAKASIVFAYVGTLGVQDGVDYFLRALKHLEVDLHRTDWYCIIIGRGDALQDLMSLTSQLGLDSHILFTGPAGLIPDADLIRYLSTADICVDPDPSNPFNDRSTMLKIMEYMALGKPTVAFDLPEHRRTAGEAAVYVTPNDELAFAHALAALMDDPLRRQEMGRVGRERVETVLAWSHSAHHLLESYRRLTGHPHGQVATVTPPAQ